MGGKYDFSNLGKGIKMIEMENIYPCVYVRGTYVARKLIPTFEALAKHIHTAEVNLTDHFFMDQIIKSMVIFHWQL